MTNLQLQRNQWWEAKRHNIQQELEMQRHNYASEELSRAANEETHRANVAKEQLTAQEQELEAAKIAETARSNQAREIENLRHNSMAEKLDAYATKLTDKREWEKLSQQQQRHMVQNTVDKATAQQKAVETALKKAELEAGLPKLQARKIYDDMDKWKQELLVQKQQFEKNYQLNKKATDAQSAEAYAKAANESARKLGIAVDNYSKIYSAIEKIFDKIVASTGE